MTCRKTPYLIELSRKTLITSVSVVLAMIVVLIAGILVIDLPLPLSVLGY